jgi:MFS family permease
MSKLENFFTSIRALGSERIKFLTMVTGGHVVIHWFQQFFPVVLPTLKGGLGLDDVQVGALSSARQLFQGTLDLPSGLLADFFVRARPIILASALVCMGIAYFLMGIASPFFWALLGAGLVGLGTALWHPAAAASLSNQFPHNRATALAVHGMGATVSDTLTPLGAGFLLVAFPWKTVLELQVIPGLLFGFLVWRGLVRFFTGNDSHASSSGGAREIITLLKNPSFLGIAASTGLLNMGRLVVITFLPIYLQEHLGYSPFALGFYIGLMHAFGTVSQPILGYLSDRFGRKVVLIPSFMILGLLFALLGIVAPGLPLGAVVAAIGLFFYTLVNITLAAIMDVAGSTIQASSYGINSIITQVVVFPSPMLAGLLIDRYGIGSAFLLAAVFLLLAALVCAPLKLYRGARG